MINKQMRVPKELHYRVFQVQQMVLEQTGVKIPNETALKMIMGPIPKRMVLKRKFGTGAREFEFIL